MRGVLANRRRTADTPNLAAQEQFVSRKTHADLGEPVDDGGDPLKHEAGIDGICDRPGGASAEDGRNRRSLATGRWLPVDHAALRSMQLAVEELQLTASPCLETRAVSLRGQPAATEHQATAIEIDQAPHRVAVISFRRAVGRIALVHKLRREVFKLQKACHPKQTLPLRRLVADQPKHRPGLTTANRQVTVAKVEALKLEGDICRDSDHASELCLRDGFTKGLGAADGCVGGRR